MHHNLYVFIDMGRHVRWRSLRPPGSSKLLNVYKLSIWLCVYMCSQTWNSNPNKYIQIHAYASIHTHSPSTWESVEPGTYFPRNHKRTTLHPFLQTLSTIHLVAPAISPDSSLQLDTENLLKLLHLLTQLLVRFVSYFSITAPHNSYVTPRRGCVKLTCKRTKAYVDDLKQ